MKKCCNCSRSNLPDCFYAKANEEHYGKNQYICIFCILDTIDWHKHHGYEGTFEIIMDLLSKEFNKYLSSI